MNDFEDKLRQQAFRIPPADLREALFGSDAPAEKIITPPPSTWRDCLWPSPKAWAALAALWLIMAVLFAVDRPDPSTSFATSVSPSSETVTPNLLTYHKQPDHVFESAN